MRTGAPVRGGQPRCFAAFACAGCSFQLDSMFSKSEPDGDITGSVGQPGKPRTAQAAQVSEADLAYARAAATDTLSRGGKANSVPWQNPQTGVGGNITPLASYSAGRPLLPRFPGELRERRLAGLAAGLGLPERQRRLAGQEPQAAEIELIAQIVGGAR